MTIREALRTANRQIAKKIDNAMTREVFRAVRDEESATILTEVYDVYTPQIYNRRGKWGGLGDPYNIEIRGGTAQNGVLVVVNMTEPNPGGTMDNGRVTTGKNLPELVEYGNGYKNYTYDYQKWRARYMKPRPFTARTVENLRESGAHISALRSGLERQDGDIDFEITGGERHGR